MRPSWQVPYLVGTGDLPVNGFCFESELHANAIALDCEGNAVVGLHVEVHLR